MVQELGAEDKIKGGRLKGETASVSPKHGYLREISRQPARRRRTDRVRLHSHYPYREPPPPGPAHYRRGDIGAARADIEQRDPGGLPRAYDQPQPRECRPAASQQAVEQPQVGEVPLQEIGGIPRMIHHLFFQTSLHLPFDGEGQAAPLPRPTTSAE